MWGLSTAHVSERGPRPVCNPYTVGLHKTNRQSVYRNYYWYAQKNLITNWIHPPAWNQMVIKCYNRFICLNPLDVLYRSSSLENVHGLCLVCSEIGAGQLHSYDCSFVSEIIINNTGKQINEMVLIFAVFLFTPIASFDATIYATRNIMVCNASYWRLQSIK